MNAIGKHDSILCSTVVHETVYYPELPFSPLDFSGYVQVSVVMEGCGVHRILSQADECHTGDLYVIGNGIHHSFFAKSAEEKPTVCTLCFDPAKLFPNPWADPESLHYCYGVFRDHVPVSYAMLNASFLAEFSHAFSAITQELAQQDIQWQAAAANRLTLLLILIARYINMADTARKEHPKEWITVSAAMRLALVYCSDSNMTLDSIASALYVSPSHLSRLFPKVSGDTFMEYVRKIRISLACRLLSTTDLTNEQIMMQCGLKDIPSFYRIFKTYMGMTPYQYRMSQQVYSGTRQTQIYGEISENLQHGNAKAVKEWIQTAIAEGIPALQILNEGLVAGMNIIAEQFKSNEIYVPEVLVAARAMNLGMQLLKPLLTKDGMQTVGKVCIGTVQGDLHDVGKNLVKMMMESKRLEVIDLGIDVSADKFIQTAIAEHCQVICCSALLTTTMNVMEEIVQAAERAGIRDKVKIMIGGGPVNEAFRASIGADCYTPDAASAADAAVAFCRR